MNEPTNRELELMLKNISEKSDERHLDYKETHIEIKGILTALVAQVKEANHRTAKLESWSGEAKEKMKTRDVLIDSYREDKTRIWTAMAILLFVGGSFISLSIMAIDNKIKIGVNNALIINK